MNFKTYYQERLDIFEEYLISSFPDVPQEVSVLAEAMKYSLLAGGKRIRPIFLLATLEAAGRDFRLGLSAACALEYIHTYSLIHDDLPCMDDDNLRRGLPTSHLKFGEDIALLAGDALLTHAFYLLSAPEFTTLFAPYKILKIIQLLTGKAGIHGMISGQTADIIKYQGESPLKSIDFIHQYKTGALITASIQIGAILADVNRSVYEHLTDFGDRIGKCFQIKDDILDKIGDVKNIGKTPGSDDKNDKLTYPSIVGLKRSEQYTVESLNRAISSLQKTGLEETTRLQQIAEYIINRDH